MFEDLQLTGQNVDTVDTLARGMWVITRVVLLQNSWPSCLGSVGHNTCSTATEQLALLSGECGSYIIRVMLPHKS